MSSTIPRATQGVKIASMYVRGESVSVSAPCLRPQVREVFPKALLKTTISEKTNVLKRILDRWSEGAAVKATRALEAEPEPGSIRPLCDRQQTSYAFAVSSYNRELPYRAVCARA